LSFCLPPWDNSAGRPLPEAVPPPWTPENASVLYKWPHFSHSVTMEQNKKWVCWAFLKKMFWEKKEYIFLLFFIVILCQLYFLPSVPFFFFQMTSWILHLCFHPYFHWVLWDEIRASALIWSNFHLFHNIYVFLPEWSILFIWNFILCLCEVLQFSSPKSKTFSVGIIPKQFVCPLLLLK
jgi:hypothetical protein